MYDNFLIRSSADGHLGCFHVLAICLPLCLWCGEGPVHTWLALLWYLLSTLFCERARLCLRAFHGKVLFFSLAISQFKLKLKLQYFGHLMPRVDSLEKTDAG